MFWNRLYVNPSQTFAFQQDTLHEQSGENVCFQQPAGGIDLCRAKKSLWAPPEVTRVRLALTLWMEPPWQAGWCLRGARGACGQQPFHATPLTPKCPPSRCEVLIYIYFLSQDEHANLSPLSASHQALVHSLALFMKVYINQTLQSFIKFLFWSTHSL